MAPHQGESGGGTDCKSHGAYDRGGGGDAPYGPKGIGGGSKPGAPPACSKYGQPTCCCEAATAAAAAATE